METLYQCAICSGPWRKAAGDPISRPACQCDNKGMPDILRNGDQWACSECHHPYTRPPSGITWHSYEPGIVKSHVEAHKEARKIRTEGFLIEEREYPAIVGKGFNERAETLTAKTWALNGKFVGDRGLAFENNLLLGKLRAELPGLKLNVGWLERDLGLSLSSYGKDLIGRNLETLKRRVATIEKALP